MTTEEMLAWLQENAEKISPENKAILLAAGIKINDKGGTEWTKNFARN